MRTGVSLEARLLIEADRAAREIGVSRRRLFSRALEGYLGARRDRRILDQLNEAYSTEPTSEEKQIVWLMRTKFSATVRSQNGESCQIQTWQV